MSINEIIGSIATTAFVLAGTIVGAQESNSGSGNYPAEVTRIAPAGSVNRGCTQLEYHAGIAKADCGTMTLTEIVQFMHPAGADDAEDQLTARE